MAGKVSLTLANEMLATVMGVLFSQHVLRAYNSWRAVVALGSQSALAMEWMMGSEPHSLPIFLNAAVDPALFWTAAATSRSFLQVQCLVFLPSFLGFFWFLFSPYMPRDPHEYNWC